MEISRRDALAVGGSLTVGILAGGLLGAGVREVATDASRRIVGTREEETVAVAEEVAGGREEVVDLGERRTLVVGRLTDEEVADLLEDHEVDYVELDLRVEAGDATDVRYGAAADAGEVRDEGAARVPWGVARVDAPGAHEAGYRGDGASVAVVDSGVRPHPDIAPNIGEGVAFVECDGDCDGAWYDDAGHGTTCAGVVAATGRDDGLLGVAPAATVHPVKVLDGDNGGRVSLVVEGLRWAVAQGCDVANLSVSGPVSRAFDDALRFASLRGTVVVASAGNVGPCDDCINPLATHRDVVAVTATDREDRLATFSATGSEADLAAPGVSVTSTGRDGYVTKSGTSFSAPHVAGAAALCRASGRSASVTRELVTGAAEPVDLDASRATASWTPDPPSSRASGRTRPSRTGDGRRYTGRSREWTATAPRRSGSASGGGPGGGGGPRPDGGSARRASAPRPCASFVGSRTTSGPTRGSPTAGSTWAGADGSRSPSGGDAAGRRPTPR